jgi:hypothetical protein
LVHGVADVSEVVLEHLAAAAQEMTWVSPTPSRTIHHTSPVCNVQAQTLTNTESPLTRGRFRA